MTDNVKDAGESTTIEVFPAKRFFVDSLTRDIDLADAILDLLDNCVDGVRRLGPQPGHRYDNYKAEIEFNDQSFSITDNCGGISKHDAINSAFRFGRPNEYAQKSDGTIGVIGIGMKRAILKMGRAAVVHSHHSESSFEVKISPQWLDDDKDWRLHSEDVSSDLPAFGTRIVVTELNESVSHEFLSELFKNKLLEKVTAAFSLLTARGFGVSINGQAIKGQIPSLLWQEEAPSGATAIRPFIYREIIDDVEVYLAVGFREADKESQDETKRYYSSAPAGWTVACNDRVVLYCDKSEQTGWGTGRVPEYHTQFIRISGFAEFRSSDTTKLPFTTTKHGINQQNRVFLKVFDQMREGTKLFTDWTNLFSEYTTQREEVFSTANARSTSVEDIKQKTKAPQPPLPGTGIGKPSPIREKPNLPRPKTERKEKTISFKRPEAEIRTVSQFLNGHSDERPSKVGECCFDMILNDAKDAEK